MTTAIRENLSTQRDVCNCRVGWGWCTAWDCIIDRELRHLHKFQIFFTTFGAVGLYGPGAPSSDVVAGAGGGGG